VEVVQGLGELAESEIFFPQLRHIRDLFLTRRYRGQGGENRLVGRVFHFRGVPITTAGFIGFEFDIREVIKVGGGRGEKRLCRWKLWLQ
jgi:hypothetical protein